jgi:hypothetical protein
MYSLLLLRFRANILYVGLFGSLTEQRHFPHITDQASFELQMQLHWYIISGPCIAAKTRLLSFNRTQSRVVIGLLTGHNTFSLWDWATVHCVENAGQRSKPELLFCVSVKPWRHTDTLIWVPFLFLDSEDVRELSLGAIWNFIKRTGLLWLGLELRGTKDLSKAYVHRERKGLTHYLLITHYTDIVSCLTNKYSTKFYGIINPLFVSLSWGYNNMETMHIVSQATKTARYAWVSICHMKMHIKIW